MIVVRHRLLLLLLLCSAPACTCAGATYNLALSRLLALGSSSAGQPAARHTLVPRHNVDQEVEQIGSTNGTCNVGSLNRPPLVLLRNQKGTTGEVGDKDLARPGKEDRCFGRDHLDLVVGLHHLLDARQRQLSLSRKARLEVNDVAVGVSALLDEVHLVSPKGGLEVVEIL